MKIKEVIEQTGLTDRAIRLYIEDGLVFPKTEESYNGRKNIDFSESDTGRLKNIAVMRKAGFSIADIKEMFDDTASVTKIVSRFIEDTENGIDRQRKVVNALKSVTLDENAGVEAVCAALSEKVQDEKLPKEDTSYKEDGRFVRRFGVVGIIVSLLGVVQSVAAFAGNFKFPCFTKESYGLLLWANAGFILMLLLSLLLAVRPFKRRLSKTGKKKMREFSMLMIIALFIPSFIGYGFAHSQTTDIKNYLVFDEVVETEQSGLIKMCFPSEIPSFSETDLPPDVKYYYNCNEPISNTYSYELLAEWSLSKTMYEAAKKEAPHEINGFKVHTEKRGDWMCTVYANGEEFSEGYVYLMFAYNDELKKVRYIASYAKKEGIPPYHLSLTW